MYKPTDWLNINRWQKTCHKHRNHEKVGMAILLLGKIHFTFKTAWPTK